MSTFTEGAERIKKLCGAFEAEAGLRAHYLASWSGRGPAEAHIDFALADAETAISHMQEAAARLRRVKAALAAERKPGLRSVA